MKKLAVLLHKLRQFFYPDMYEFGIEHVRDNWETIGPRKEAYLSELSYVESVAGGGPFEDGLREGIRRMEKQNEQR